jgi:hemerythrin
MAALIWKDEYLVNVSVMDKQHRRLAELVGRLHETAESDSAGEDLFIALNELVGFTRLHFATEEELMLKYDFPGYAEHRTAHKELLAGLQALLTTVRDKVSVGFDPGGDINDDWVARHLLERDRDLGKYLNSRGVF